MEKGSKGEAYELLARAPLRISLAGGGTDLPAYYEQHGGMVVSTTIDKSVYVHCRSNGLGEGHGAQITSADYRTFYRHPKGSPMRWDGDLALPRAVLHTFGVDGDISIFLASEVPPGTGLGSSSAVAVALVQAVSAHLGQSLTRHQIAELACEVELSKLKAPIGKQDQYAAAFGGLNCITFAREGVTVESVRVMPGILAELEGRLMLFFTGSARDSATILKKQQDSSARGDSRTVDGLHHIKAAASVCRECLENGDLDGIGAMLNESWRHKMRLVEGISNPWIDELYGTALSNGAMGGKITGAGGGGFLLLYCHKERQEEVTEAMEASGLRRMDFHFEREGVTIAEMQWGEIPELAVAKSDAA